MPFKNNILIKKNQISYILKKKTKNGLKKSVVFYVVTDLIKMVLRQTLLKNSEKNMVLSI